LRGEVGGVQEDRNITGTTVVPRDVLDVAREAALSAGAELTARYGRPAEGLGAKAHPTDLVSDADRAAEAAIAAVLARRRPDDGILGEEGTANREGSTGLRWVVDPLDGTVNYLSGIPLWCVSIACEDAVGTLAGVVHDPLRGIHRQIQHLFPGRLGKKGIQLGRFLQLGTLEIALQLLRGGG